MNPNILNSLDSLRSRGWKWRTNEGAAIIPGHILERYPWVQEEILAFILSMQVVINAEGTSWLLTASDYLEQPPTNFRWNEWEILSLDAASSEPEWQSAIREFWDEHFPIGQSVGDGYAYWAVTREGSIVEGREPEFEEVTLIANDFSEFLSKLATENSL